MNKKYIVISETGLEHLCVLIDKKLNEGYELYGSMSSSYDSKEDLFNFFQPMTFVKKQIVAKTSPLSSFKGDDLLSFKEVLELTKIKRATWYNGMKENRYPAPLKMGKRRIMWLKKDIYDFMNNLINDRNSNLNQDVPQ